MSVPITDERWVEIRRAAYEQARRLLEEANKPEAKEREARELVADDYDYESGVYKDALRDVLALLDDERLRHP